jgi:hypothetical protein
MYRLPRCDFEDTAASTAKLTQGMLEQRYCRGAMSWYESKKVFRIHGCHSTNIGITFRSPDLACDANFEAGCVRTFHIQLSDVQVYFSFVDIHKLWQSLGVWQVQKGHPHYLCFQDQQPTTQRSRNTLANLPSDYISR